MNIPRESLSRNFKLENEIASWDKMRKRIASLRLSIELTFSSLDALQEKLCRIPQLRSFEAQEVLTRSDFS